MVIFLKHFVTIKTFWNGLLVFAQQTIYHVHTDMRQSLAKRSIAEQANKTLFSLLKTLSLPLDLQIDLINKTIKPILLYGSEIWDTGNIDVIERV